MSLEIGLQLKQSQQLILTPQLNKRFAFCSFHALN